MIHLCTFAHSFFSIFNPSDSPVAPSLPIPTAPEIENFACWDRFKKWWTEPSEAELQLLSIEGHLLDDWEHNRQVLLNMLVLASSGANRYSPTGKRLQMMISQLDSEHLNDFLRLTAQKAVEEYHPQLSQFLLQYLTIQQLEQFLKEKIPGIDTINELVKASTVKNDPDQNAQKQSFIHTLVWGVKKTLTPIASFFPNLLNVFIRAFNLENTSRSPSSIWDYSAMLTIYLNVFLLPHAVYILVGAFVAVSWQAYLITALVVAVFVLLLFIYITWLKPCPDTLSQMTNYTEEMKKRTTSPCMERSEEINNIIATLGTKKADGEHMNIVMVGPTGVGKSELFQGIAWEFQQREELKNKKIFYISAFHLFENQLSTPPVEQIINFCNLVKGYEKEVVFCFDELQAFLGSGTTPLLIGALKTRIEKNGIQCIAATTEEGWDEICKIDKDGSFQDRFQKKTITPLKPSSLLSILQNFEKHDSCPIQIEENVLQTIIESVNPPEKGITQLRKTIKVLVKAISLVNDFQPLKYKSPALLAKKKELGPLKSRLNNRLGEGKWDNLQENDTIERQGTLEREIKLLKKENQLQREQAQVMYNLLREQKKIKNRRIELKGRLRKLSEKNRDDLLKELAWIDMYLSPAYRNKIEQDLAELPVDMPLQISKKLIEKILAEHPIVA